MDRGNTFKTFCNTIHLDDTSRFDTSINEITKKLNKKYYDTLSIDDYKHIVGSIGRGTAIEYVSDVDMIFELPGHVYSKFNAYESNGQSALLQEIKDVIKERYPKTKIKGDGQVVAVKFSDFTIELVPAFRQSDNNFKYPDTHDGGSWKITKPFPEQDRSSEIESESKGTFVHLCNILRSWKDNVGFKFGGLLIDTLVHNFLIDNEEWNDTAYEDYIDLLIEVFKYLKDLNSEQAYWYALGSNQLIYNNNDGKFVKKAKKAYNKLVNCDDGEDLEEACKDLFGKRFKDSIVGSLTALRENSLILKHSAINAEEFIEDKFSVEINFNIRIDCEVNQSGWRPTLLSIMLKDNIWLQSNKELRFHLKYCNVEEPYDIYWKVRNRGEEAIRRNQIRGRIKKGSDTKIERTSFNGNHYVECYIIKDDVCVARDSILVPISTR